MELKVGEIVTGKVTGIMKFGAFVSIAPNKSGLVHISEIANTFVNDIKDHLTEGQEVKVKIIGIDENGRINLSIKKAVEQPRQTPQENGNRRSFQPRANQFANQPRDTSSMSFEDKLKQFMQDSDSKMSGIKQYEKKTSRRRSGGGNRSNFD